MSAQPHSSNSTLTVDLHLHSLYSDGVLPPAEVVDRVADAGAGMLSLTDHDTLAGLPEARQRCTERGVSWIAGVELSCSWRGQSLHVLGFDFDPRHLPLEEWLGKVREQRRVRLREIARRLERKRIAAVEMAARIEAAHDVVTRTHLARDLVAAKHAKNVQDAFKHLLGRGSPGHCAVEYPTMASTVECIIGSGGLAVLAHPLRYTLSAGARRQLLQEFREAGGQGMEVVCGGARGHIEPLATLAASFGLAASAGSDFHDPQIPWNPPGRLAKLPASVRPIWHSFGRAGKPSRQ
jgi:predicted metal-dependent phosphoesterase TrpH